jgi:hypothetical protein
MYEPLVSGGAYAVSRRNRFGGAVSDEYIRRYITTRSSAVFCRWRAARCRRAAPARASQSRRVGSALFERVLLVARNRRIESTPDAR